MTSSLINAARGEVALTINGTPHRLCLTLGALAQLETHFAVAGPSALASRLRTLSASDLLIVLQALLTGGGEDISPDALSRAAITPTDAAHAIARAFAAALGPDAANP